MEEVSMEYFIEVLRRIAENPEVGEGDANADQVANNLIGIAKDVLEERGIDYEEQ